MKRVLHLLPYRAFGEQNVVQEIAALESSLTPIVSPYPGLRGILWLETVGVRMAIRLKPDIVSARDLDALGAAVKVKRRTGARLVYDMHEVYSYMIEDDVPSVVARLAERRERRLLPTVDLAIASDGGRAEWLRRQGYSGKTFIVMNCRDPSREYLPPPNDKTLCYTGTLHRSRFIRETVSAMDGLPGVSLVVAGPNTPNSEYGWLKENYGVGPEGGYGDEQVLFLGAVSPRVALALLQDSDASVQMADPAKRINTLGPYNRLFDAMSVGRPSIGTVGTENGNIISRLKLGVTSMYDTESYVAAVKAFFGLSDEDRDRLGRNAYDMCVRVFNWKNEADTLREAYRCLE